MSVMLPNVFAQTKVSQYQIADFNHGSVVSTTQLCDGTKMAVDSEGRIFQAQYASGAVVRRHEGYVIVRSADSSYWFGNSAKTWHPID